jgi:hypothetical protein
VRRGIAAAILLLGAAGADAEPMFLSKQYNRCTSCHYSATGGGLLTPYGRSLSRQELSTKDPFDPTVPPPPPSKREEAFLWGALGDLLGPVQVGIDLRPSHMALDVGGPTSSTMDFFMTADFIAALRTHGFTAYGEVGRKPAIGTQPAGVYSYEHWIGYQSSGGLGLRAGRFYPAYGIRFADHSDFNRAPLGFEYYDQDYALEVSHTGERHLLQVSVGPGRADSIIHGDPHAFTTTARFEWDLGPRTVLAVSGLYRDATSLQPKNGSTGIAFGIAPTRRISNWTEVDAQFQQGTGGAPSPGPAYVLINETSLEVFRGLWLKFAPQIRTDYGDTSGGTVRMNFEADLYPRTHWNVDVSYYHDRGRLSGFTYETLLFQLHLYL